MATDFNSMNNWNLGTPQLPQTDYSQTFGDNNLATQGIFDTLNLGGQGGAPQQDSGGMFSMDNMFGGADGQGGSGWLTSGLNTATGLVNAWQGLESLKLGKESFNFNKGVTETNLANQAKTINADQNDRQQRRLSATGGQGWDSLADYKAKNNVSGTIGG